MRDIILGTDWWTDCDDVVALRMLLRAHKRGDICLEGIVLNGCMEHSVRSLDGFCQLEGCGEMPIGVDLAATDFGGNPPYQKRLAAYGTRYRCNEEAENGVRLYRRLLAAATEPVELIEVGYLQTFAALLQSTGDDLSPLPGRELVAQKVSHCWVMAGKWDADGEKENNFCRNPRAREGGAVFCGLCPVPVTFLGWEVGFDVISGSRLAPDDPLLQALQDHGSPNGRASWDPMLVLLALAGDPEQAGYRTICGTARLDRETGQNYFDPAPEGRHRYVVKVRENGFYQDEIDRRIQSR